MPAAPRVALRILFGLIAAAVLAYAIDELVPQFSRSPYGSVTVRSYYAVATKDGHVDYMYNDAIEQPCVHALFPHGGASPLLVSAPSSGTTDRRRYRRQS